ncbi:uncharacterized protein LOC114530817 [Dendronephthya gigantea]|uniref:uncharacterized protein LOC114530817 n=1 Tax=Dendronephthya gigantea TaxID=151771 RepID=UPI00106DA31F|nr:uncharacterized protein LOC114530817 [Dendronephthya gigantea]
MPDTNKSLKKENNDLKLEIKDSKVDGLTNDIDSLECYSYQYNVKLVGIPQLKTMESSLETSKLCVQLFKEMGVAGITLEDIDIAHRVPGRKALRDKPIICKFSRRIVKDQVINCRRNINKVNPNTVGLAPDVQLSEARVFDHLTPSLQKLLFEAKKIQQQQAYKFCWVKNSKIFLRKHDDSRAVEITKLSDLEDLAAH